MSISTGVVLPLQTIYCTDRKLRYFTVAADLHAVVLNGDMLNETPLFLASDVLNGTSVSPDNQPRIHARYGKQGLASKLSFPSGTKVSGLHGIGRGVWFYNILGAMKVTFEFHSPDQQVAMMDLLQHVWHQRYKDPPVPLCLAIHHIETCSKDNDGAHSSCKRSAATRPDVESTSGNRIKRHSTIILGNAIPKKKRTLQDFEEDNVLLRDESDASMQGNISELAVHHVEEVLTNSESAPPCQCKGRCWCKRVQEGIATCSVEGERDLLLQLDTVMQSLGSRLYELSRSELETCIDVLDCISTSLNDTSKAPIAPEDSGDPTTDIKQKQCERITEAVAVWLGSRFSAEVSEISERVEAFKLRNIDQINSLPRPDRLVRALFPKSMVDFLMSWMGVRQSREMITRTDVGDENSTITSTTFPAELNGAIKTYGSDGNEKISSENMNVERKDVETEACFPLVQFILELANQTLISGMAHVIYPRLIQNATM